MNLLHYSFHVTSRGVTIAGGFFVGVLIGFAFKKVIKLGYISKPTLGEAARFCFDLVATNYVDQGEMITQKLKTIIPIRDYNKLELELSSTKAELTAEKQMNSLQEKAIEAHVEAYETQSHALENISNTLKDERKEFSDFRVTTSRIGNRMQEIAKEGGYLKQELGQFSEAPRVILNERQTSVTEEQNKRV